MILVLDDGKKKVVTGITVNDGVTGEALKINDLGEAKVENRITQVQMSRIESLLIDISKELKYLRMHMQTITDDELTEGDIHGID